MREKETCGREKLNAALDPLFSSTAQRRDRALSPPKCKQVCCFSPTQTLTISSDIYLFVSFLAAAASSYYKRESEKRLRGIHTYNSHFEA